jgi:ribosome biogenesis GTPase A
MNLTVESIPPETMQAWIDQLSTVHPTYPLLTKSSNFDHTLTPTTSLETLKSAILKTSTACVLGIPHIGKTTLIHTLLGTKSRSTPTHDLKSHTLSSTTLLDTPHLPLTPHPLLPLLNLGKPTQQTIQYLLTELGKLPDEYYGQLETVYGLPGLVRPIEGNRFVDPAKDLLVAVARQKGRMGRQGPNLEGAAEVVGLDCVKGKIRWWMVPSLKKGKKTKSKK